jgi:hypothetical protein
MTIIFLDKSEENVYHYFFKRLKKATDYTDLRRVDAWRLSNKRFGWKALKAGRK